MRGDGSRLAGPSTAGRLARAGAVDPGNDDHGPHLKTPGEGGEDRTHRAGHHPHKEFIGPDELAERWHVSVRTLQGWRTNGRGPHFIELAPNMVRYDLDEIGRHEAACTWPRDGATRPLRKRRRPS